MRVSATEWNKMVDYIFANRLMSVLGADPSGWLHPWHTTPRWNADYISEEGRIGRFEATIKPGFVNGLDVTVLIQQRSTTVNNSQPSSTPLPVPLTDSPSIPLTTTRAVTSNVPACFLARGVRSATAPTQDQLDQGISEIVSGLPSDASTDRQLHACDIVLRCARARTIIDWQITPAETGAIAQFTVSSSPGLQVSSSAFTLHVINEFTAVEPMSDFDRLNGATNDPGYDAARVCTVFFLSPPGVGPDYELDETWEMHVEHALFWNADHIVTAPIATQAQNLQINLAGLGGNAQFNVNQILATNNDAFAAAQQFLHSREITGKITTPGQRTVKWDKEASLDPPFPFIGLPE